MYFTISIRSKPVPTLLSSLNGLGFFLIFTARFISVSGRIVYNHLLFSGFNPELLDPLLLDEWAGVQGFWLSVQSDLKPTPSRQHVEPKVSGSPTYGATTSYPTPASVPLLNQYDLTKLHRRDTFSSNVCSISVQTTIYVSIDGASTSTLSSVVGPRPTGIPGDTGMPDGTGTTGGESGTGTTGSQSFGNKEGLITGLLIVFLILSASLWALCTYFYKKRRNARLQRMSAQPHSDTADIVRRTGSNLSNSARSFSRSERWLQWSPLGSLRGLFSRLKPSSRRNPKRDSQNSELLVRKRRMGQADRGNTTGWSVVGNSAAEPDYSEKHLGVQPTKKRSSGNPIPEIISSPALSSLKLSSPPKLAARLSVGEPGPVDYMRRVSPNYRPALSALHPIAVEPGRLGSAPDLGRDASPRRDSQGEPLSPSAWMAGFGLASGSHVDPFPNPSHVSSSGDPHDFVQPTSKISDPGSPLSNAPSSGSDRTPRGRQTSPQRYNHERLSAVVEPSDVRPDGTSDIISTFGSAFGDRPSSHHTASTIDDDGRLPETQFVQYHPLSDLEEVLTPVADERLSIQPGSTPFTWRETRDSFGQRSARNSHISMSPAVQRAAERPLSQLTEFVNPLADRNASPSLPPSPMSRGRRPVLRRKSEATSLQGGFLPSEESASTSLTGTSIVDLGPPIDTGDWDDAASRRREEDQLFYIRPETAASNRLNSNHTQ